MRFWIWDRPRVRPMAYIRRFLFQYSCMLVPGACTQCHILKRMLVTRRCWRDTQLSRNTEQWVPIIHTWSLPTRKLANKCLLTASLKFSDAMRQFWRHRRWSNVSRAVRNYFEMSSNGRNFGKIQVKCQINGGVWIVFYYHRFEMRKREQQRTYRARNLCPWSVSPAARHVMQSFTERQPQAQNVRQNES